MYKEFYKFNESAFSPQPDLRFLYLSESHRRVLEMVECAVHERSVCCVIGAEAGIGKTMLIRALIQRLDEYMRAGLVNCMPDSELSLTELSASAFGLDTANACTSEMNQCLADYIAGMSQAGTSALLIIDDAHNLAPETFKGLVDLPGINNTLQVILVGRPELRQHFSRRELSIFAPRVIVQCDLPALSMLETDAYIRHRIAAAGGSAGLFAKSASEAVYQYSQGVPELIDYACNLALKAGYEGKYSIINKSLVSALFKDRHDSTVPDCTCDQQPVKAGQETADEAKKEQADETPVVQRQGIADNVLSEETTVAKRPKTMKDDEKDIADFIRLSMQHQRRQTRRLAYGSLASILVLTSAVLWLLFQQSNDRMDNGIETLISNNFQPTTEQSDDKKLGLYIGDVAAAVKQPEADPVTSGKLPLEQNAQAPTAFQAEPVNEQPQPLETSPPPLVSIPSRSELLDETRKLKKIKALEARQHKVERRLKAQRVERAKLKKEMQREQERILKARSLLKEAKKNARYAWDQLHKATPEPYFENADDQTDMDARTRARLTWDKLNNATPEAYPEDSENVSLE